MSALAQAPAPTTPTTPTTPSTDKSKTPTTPSTDKTKDTAKAGKLTDDEVKIVAHLHHVNVMEIDGGKQAKAKGTAAVKKYGDMMIKDHTAADKELTAMAKKRGVAKIPAPTPATETEKTEMKASHDKMAAVKKLKGADFDREYLTMMVEDHDKELAKSDVLIASAQDPDLKAMLEARKTTLQRHADAARELQKTAAGGTTSSTTTPAAPTTPSKATTPAAPTTPKTGTATPTTPKTGAATTTPSTGPTATK